MLAGATKTKTAAATKAVAADVPDKTSLTQAELVKMIAEKNGKMTQKEATKILKSVIEAISEGLAAGKSVALKDLGTFSTYESAERTGRNPGTGEALTIPAKRRLKFKAYSAIKALVEAK